MSTTEWQIITQIWSSYSSCCMCSNSRQKMSKQWLPCRSATAVAPPAPQWAPRWPRSAAANTAVPPPMIAVAPPSNRSGNSMGSPCPQWHRRGSAVIPPWFRSSTAKKNTCVTGRGKLWKTTGGVTTVMAVLAKNRSGTAPPVWRGY